ncbi:unnamed protein product [Ostreobium quekettii]|uniref:MICOS complex subunit MIC60 n=1 Tax=Ostreobium quekettii TaxID=121088 RepID=A0A8S1IKY4_9CHLO|nr:unnamed protein product [Ostreobium quekettii]|eukprot:evm.model.scf_48.10 EVM.evm.TU.scf_48.10   scf_48:54104-61274(+)
MRACMRGAQRGLRHAQLANCRRKLTTRQGGHPPSKGAEQKPSGDHQGAKATPPQAKPQTQAAPKGGATGTPGGTAPPEAPRAGLPPWVPVAAAAFGFGSLAYLGVRLAAEGPPKSLPGFLGGRRRELQEEERAQEAPLETAEMSQPAAFSGAGEDGAALETAEMNQPAAFSGAGEDGAEKMGVKMPEVGVGDSGEAEEPVVIDTAPLDQLFTEALGLPSVAGQQDASAGGVAGDGPDGQATSAQIVEASEDSSTPYEEEVLMAKPSPLPTPAQSITADLVQKVIEQGAGAGEDWEKYKAMHQQATCDAETVIQKMAEQEVQHKVETQQLELKIAEHAAKVEDIRAEADDQLKKTQALLEKQEEVAEQQRENELKRQAEYMAVAASEAAVKERTERIKLMDQVREKLNVLEEAFVQRSKDALLKSAVHNVALGAMALDQALREGLPCSKPLRFLESGCGQDPVVLLGLSAVPKEVAQRGVPTQTQLLDRFKDVKKSVLTLSYLPPEGGGVLAHFAAKIGAALKVREDPTPTGTLDAALSQMEEWVRDGHLASAAQELEKATAGTAAEACTKDWLEAARSRAAAEQTVKMLQARAMSLTVALL